MTQTGFYIQIESEEREHYNSPIILMNQAPKQIFQTLLNYIYLTISLWMIICRGFTTSSTMSSKHR